MPERFVMKVSILRRDSGSGVISLSRTIPAVLVGGRIAMMSGMIAA
jgi:hypothetical protein